MRKRFLCPRHKEKSPSVVVYSTHGFCFGCGAIVPHSELGMGNVITESIEYVEDLQATVNYIKSLPTKKIRGFDLHFSSRGYYILWPDESYYKLRLDGVESGSKYRGPTGHKKTPLVLSGGYSLALVEGEFNAMSLNTLEIPGLSVISPGAASDFYSKGAERYLQEYAKYSKVFIVVDDDTAGLLAGIECKSRLAALGASQVEIKLVKKDFNDLYVEEGKEGLAAHCRDLGLYGGV